MEHFVLLGSTCSFADPQSIIEAFEADIADAEISCNFQRRTQQFKVRCRLQDMDRVASVFVKTIRERLHSPTAHDGTRLDDLASAGMSHSSEIQELDSMESIYNYVDKEDNRTQVDHSLHVEPLIMHETLKRTWHSELSRQSMDAAFPTAVLHELEVITQCRIERLENKLVVLADSQSVLDVVVHKLEVLRDSCNALLRPLWFDFYFDEGLIGYQLRFSAPLDAIDDGSVSQGQFFKDYYGLSMVWWDSIAQQHVTRHSPRSAMLCASKERLFSSLFSFAFGDERLRFSSQVSNTNRKDSSRNSVASVETQHVAEWAHTVSAHPIDPFSENGIKPSSARAQGSQVETSLKTLRTPRGLSQGSNNKRDGSFPEITMPAITPIVDIGPSNLTVPRIQKLPLIRATNVNSPTTEDVVQSDHSHGMLKDDSVKKSNSMDECLQAMDEDQTRDLCHLPSLLGPKMKKPRPAFDYTKMILPALEQMLNGCRAVYSSVVNLEVVIGHVYIKKDTVLERWRVKRSHVGQAFNPEVWSTIFRTHKNTGNAATIFSAKIHGFLGDIEQIPSLKSSNEEPLFSCQSELSAHTTDEEIFVDIICSDGLSGEQVTYTIDKKRNVAMHDPRTEFAATNLHFPDRTWDASFRLTATKNASKEKRALFQGIADGLWIRGPKETQAWNREDYNRLPFLIFKSDNRNISIESVQIRRKLSFESNQDLGDGIELFLTQITNLRVEALGAFGQSAFLDKDETCQAPPNSWYEVGLVSTRANAVLQENATLEIGEQAVYKNWYGNEDFIKRLVTMTCLLVPAMDSVGMSDMGSSSRLQAVADSIKSDARFFS